MVLLVHHPVSPFSRKIRLILSEKKMLFVLKEELPWALSDDALKLNPAGSLPIFVFDGKVIAGNYAISEFLEEANPDMPLLPSEIQKRAETRRLVEWFDDKVYLDFEGLKICAPRLYQNVLAKTYGDWRKFPANVDVGKGSLHGTVFFDPDVSYLNYDNGGES